MKENNEAAEFEHQEDFDEELEEVMHVWVRRQWNDWRHAKVNFESLENLHWDDISGGVQARSPQPFIHGYIYCNELLEGELAHTCRHGQAPHRIKVCVVQKDNAKDVIQILLQYTGLSPRTGQPRIRALTGNTCRTDILAMFDDTNNLSAKAISARLKSFGHKQQNIRHVLKKLVSEGLLAYEGQDPQDKRFAVYQLR